ncbi:MAG: hypothetical protein N4A64_11140 [Marinisporobacter sp.]|nr:hypothetical protein [Marinisporobacter sp.]
MLNGIQIIMRQAEKCSNTREFIRLGEGLYKSVIDFHKTLTDHT